jgi:hypothetical protein
MFPKPFTMPMAAARFLDEYALRMPKRVKINVLTLEGEERSSRPIQDSWKCLEYAMLIAQHQTTSGIRLTDISASHEEQRHVTTSN